MKTWFRALCFALLASLASQAYASKAVNFSFTDSKGKTIQLSDYRGKWVLVNFWAPWCPRCKMEFAELNDLDARNDFVVIGIAMDYGIDVASVHNTVERFNLRFPQVIGTNRRDPNSPALQVGPVDYYPTSYLYAPDGEIVMFVPGIISKQKILAFTEQYLQTNPTAFVQSAPPPAAASAPEPAPSVRKASHPQPAPSPAKKKVVM